MSKKKQKKESFILPEPTGSEPAKKKKLAPHHWLLIVTVTVAVIAVGTLGAGIYFYVQSQRPSQVLGTSTQDVVSQVGQLMQLPNNETPTIATVTDVTKLQSQPFFSNALNGDKVLIYQKAKEAILYRPSTNKIITVGPLNVSATAQTSPAPTSAAASSAASLANSVKTVVDNGAGISGLASTAAKDLQSKMANIQIVDKGNAEKSDYTDTLIIPVTSGGQKVAVQVATDLQGTVASLPASEKQPNADLLVIVGKNYKK